MRGVTWRGVIWRGGAVGGCLSKASLEGLLAPLLNELVASLGADIPHGFTGSL